MKATSLLRKDHETLHSLLGRQQQATAGNPQAGFIPELLEELRIHLSIEEELFYPEVESTASPAAMELVARARRQHQEIESLLDEIEQDASSANPTLDDRMAQLVQRVGAHLSFEESELFEEARQTLSEFRMEQLGLEIEDRRRILGRTAA